MKKLVTNAALVNICLLLSGNVSATPFSIGGPSINSVDTNPASIINLNAPDLGTITDLNVSVNITDASNNFWTDLDLFIEHNSIIVNLMDSIDNDNFGLFDVTFDDEALGALPTSGNAIGSFLSFQLLDVFNGQDLAGTWTLSILDDYVPDEDNSLVSWSISGEVATSASPVPAPAAIWLFGTGLVGLIGIKKPIKLSGKYT